jgi:prepilin-type N-terminal cleavage/methylation domain-containing protein
MNMSNKQKGFSFVELAVALFIMALLLGSILVPLGTQVEQRQNAETLRILEEARDALMGHAISTGRLPCPDTNNDGLENTGGTCIAGSIGHGTLPWQTLGLAPSDAWGNRIRYAVHGTYAQSATSFTLTSAVPNLRVCEISTCASILTSSAVAVLVSHGKNGWGATNVASGTTLTNPTSNDELENTDADRDFVSRIPTAIDSTAGEFDDVVIWMPLYTLFNRMVTAGKLP